MVECCINVESKENGDFSNGASNTMANLKQVFCFLKSMMVPVLLLLMNPLFLMPLIMNLIVINLLFSWE